MSDPPSPQPDTAPEPSQRGTRPMGDDRQVRRQHIGRAALAEAGYDPDLITRTHTAGRDILTVSKSVPADVAWRAYTLMRLGTNPGSGVPCFACFDAYRSGDVDRQAVLACTEPPFADRCDTGFDR